MRRVSRWVDGGLWGGIALWDPKYQGKVLAYDNGEHNFSFTALTQGVADPFHLVNTSAAYR